jgi:hypothetical protein
MPAAPAGTGIEATVQRQRKQEFKDDMNDSVYSNSSNSKKNGIGRGPNIVGMGARAGTRMNSSWNFILVLEFRVVTGQIDKENILSTNRN